MLSRSAGAITSRIASGIADTGAGALTGSAAPGTAAGAAAVTVRLAAGRASALTSAAAVAFASLKAAGPAQPCASAAASSGSSALIDRLESVQPALHAAYINQPFPLRNSRGEAGLVDLLQRRHKLIDMLGADPYPFRRRCLKGRRTCSQMDFVCSVVPPGQLLVNLLFQADKFCCTVFQKVTPLRRKGSGHRDPCRTIPNVESVILVGVGV